MSIEARSPVAGDECLGHLQMGQPDQSQTAPTQTDRILLTTTSSVSKNTTSENTTSENKTSVIPTSPVTTSVVPQLRVPLFPPGRTYSPRGIINPHLYCALNALIHVFMVTPFFTLYLMTKETTEAARPISRAIRSFLNRMWRVDNQSCQLSESIDPKKIEEAHALMYDKVFPRDLQHDADEYFTYLMRRLEKESEVPLPRISPIQHIFQGCQDDGLPFTTLYLDITGKDTRSMSCALRALFSPDGAAGGARPPKFRKLPLVLRVLLGRAAYNTKTSGRDRLEKKIELESDLFIKPAMMEKQGHPETRFSLYAVIKHVGNSATKGHYVAYVKNPQLGSWHCLDDSMVSTVDRFQVFTDSPIQSTYMLFYSRTNNITRRVSKNGPKENKKKKNLGSSNRNGSK